MIVVDTNILAYRLLAGPMTPQANALARLDPHWTAPLLWRSELRNVLAGYLRRKELNRATAEQIVLEGRAALNGGEHSVSDAVVFDLVQSSRCTSYDCEFVAMAMVLDIPLVTEDAQLLKAFPSRCRSLAQALAG